MPRSILHPFVRRILGLPEQKPRVHALISPGVLRSPHVPTSSCAACRVLFELRLLDPDCLEVYEALQRPATALDVTIRD